MLWMYQGQISIEFYAGVLQILSAGAHKLPVALALVVAAAAITHMRRE